MKQLTFKPLKASLAVLTLLFATLSLLDTPVLVRAQAPTAYSDNFDSDTVGSLAPKFVNKGSANFVVNTLGPVSGANSFGEASVVDGDIAILTGQAAGVGMTVQYTQIVHATGNPQTNNVSSNVAPMLALDAAGQNGYLANFNFGLASFAIYKDVNGNYGQSGLTGAAGASFTPFADGSKVWIKTDYDGAGTIKYKIWQYSAAEPSAWLGTATDSAPITTAGYMGLRVGTQGGAPSPQMDDLHVGPSGAVFTLAPPVVTPATSTSIHKSFLEWHPSSASAAELETNTSGAWFEFTATGTTNVSAQFDTASPVLTTIGIRWSIDGGPLTSGTAAASVSLTTNLSAGAHDVKVWMPFLPQTSDRWVTPASCVRLVSITTDAGSTVSAPTNLPNSTLLVYSDSRGEGAVINDATLAWPYLLGQALGMETGVRSFASTGWSCVNGTAAQTGSIVPFFTPGNDAQSSWDKYDGSHSLLSGGLYAQPPGMIVGRFGINDTRAGQTDAQVTASVTGFLSAARAAAGTSCPIIILSDFSGDKLAATQAGVTNYKASTPDPNTYYVAVPVIPALSDNGPSLGSADGAHPNAWYQAIEAATDAGAIRKAMAPAATSSTNTVTYLSPTVTASGANRIITFPPDSAATGYLVERSADNRATYQIIGTLSVSTLTLVNGLVSFTDTTRPATGTVYYHVVTIH